MLHRVTRSTLLGATIAALAVISAPSAAAAQEFEFSTCSTPGDCGTVDAIFTGTLLTVRAANHDNTVGSALFMFQLFFSSALNPGSPGTAFNVDAVSSTHGSVTSIGTTTPGGWVFNGIGGSNELDLTSFASVFIEGDAPSPFRASPGDPNDGTWVTTGDGYVQFDADLGGVDGVSPGQLIGIGFCGQDCIAGAAVATPEPASLTLFATGFVGLAVARRRRSKSPV